MVVKKRPDLSSLVGGLLAQHPRTRNSDKDLIIGVIQALGGNLTEKQRTIIRNISMESITRARRKYQEAGRYLPTDPDIIARRSLNEDKIRKSVRKTKPEEIIKLMENV